MVERQSYCTQCRENQRQTQINVECSECPDRPPALWPENREAWELWLLCNTQWRTGMSLIGLDYVAILQIAEVHFIEMTPALFNKIKVLEHYELKRSIAEKGGL